MVFGAGLWCWGVVVSIPSTGDEARLGARGFPMAMGLLLGALGIVLVLQALVRPSSVPEMGSLKGEFRTVACTVGLLVGYAVLLEYTGFLIATIVTVAVAVGPVLGIWRWLLITGMSGGLGFGIYLILGKLLGVYLPSGKIVNLAL